MTGYFLSAAARADLSEIFDYTYQQWGLEQAQEYLRAVHHAIERAAATPGIGRACDDVRPGYRRLATGSHTLYYRVRADDAVVVVRILHQRMDPDRHL